MGPVDPQAADFAKKVLIVLGLVVLVGGLIYVLHGASTILLLIFAGLILGIFLHWFKCLLVRRLQLPAWLALGLLITLLLASIALLFGLITPIVVEQTGALLDQVPNALENLRFYLLRYSWGDEFFKETEQPENLIFGYIREDLMKRLVGMAGFFAGTFGALMGFLLVIVIGIYLAADMGIYFEGFLRLLPPAHRHRGRAVLLRMGHVIRWWLVGQCISMTILGCAVYAGLKMIGVPYTLLFALLTAVMTFIPNLGPMLAFGPIALVALTESTTTLIYVGIFYMVVQSIEGFFLTPMVHRKIITLPPLLIISVQVLLLYMNGFVGVLLAMPLVACTMVAVRTLYIEDVLDDHRRSESF
jgi:predicted PurR-regulated permease PerM